MNQLPQVLFFPCTIREWNLVVPEKIHTSPTNRFLEILSGEGPKAIEIQAGGGG